MSIGDRVRNTRACDLIGDLERELAVPIVVLVTSAAPDELAFVFPGQADTLYVASTLDRIATACQDARRGLS